MKLVRRHLTGRIQDSNPAELSPLIQRIYAGRGVNSMDELTLSLKQLLPVTSLAHVEKAATLLATHLREGNLLIVGDFDADGATATAVACRALRLMGAKHVHYLVPNRFEYGYGLTPEIVSEARRFSPDLIVTVDNGISSIEGVLAAHKAGIKVLLTDHHLPGKKLPDADVIVNPNLHEDTFASKALAGVGVIFYIMLALKRHLQESGYFTQHEIEPPNLLTLLDLVALGTVADVVPLDLNNRILVEQGLRRVRAGKCCAGIQALFEVAGGNPKRAVSADFGFICGPRLNAAGRLDDMSLGIECLLTDSPAQARKIASDLNDLNKERRLIEDSMKAEALRELEALDLCTSTDLPTVFCLYKENWHQGVVGILAARIKDKFNRPVIAFAPSDSGKGEIKGSGRSIQGVHMRDLLEAVATQNPGLINNFGGHAMAAGLSLDACQFEVFRQSINKIAEHFNEDDTFLETHLSDGELSSEEFSLEVAESLRSSGPWGQHFPAPVFDGRFIILNKTVLKSAHLRLILKPLVSNGRTIPVQAMVFNSELALWPDKDQEIHVLYRFDVNEYKTLLSPQLIIEKLL